MKVIGGKFKGRNLLFLKDKNIRPTKDIVREAILDVLRSRIENGKVLDLFAGTGAVGIEALSQGAQEVVFVESDYEAYRLIKKNVEALGISDACRIIRGTAEKVIESLENSFFDFLIADPPYGYDGQRISEILAVAINLCVIKKDGIMAIEHGRENIIPVPDRAELFKEKKYGRSQVSYFRY
ncbi:MAG TPA: 16S rRNA (guanine(966)-N(2))-methyltransferase RsmD [bacterium]|nr:16S rRNA (guanine(966)-N(2))-methyltransferase RsmD [bacterium]